MLKYFNIVIIPKSFFADTNHLIQKSTYIAIILQKQPLKEDNCCLLFNDLETGLRLTNSNWLKDSIEAGKSAENTGGGFHPAVSRKLSRFSKSRSSKLQFEALLQNIVLAIEILEKGK